MTASVGNRIFAAIVFSVLLASLWYVWGTFTMPPLAFHQPSWQSLASRKRAELASKIPDAWRIPQDVVDDARMRRSIAGDFFDNLLDPYSRHITSLDPTDIVREIISGNLSSVDVVTAFCKRAAYIHQIVSHKAPDCLQRSTTYLESCFS